MPGGANPIYDFFSVFTDEAGQTIRWFYGDKCIRVHARNDQNTLRYMAAMLHVENNVPEAALAKALRVHVNSVRGWVKIYRERGERGFYEKWNVRGPAVMTAEVIAQCGELLEAGLSIPSAAQKLGIKAANLRKAISQGKLCHVGEIRRRSGEGNFSSGERKKVAGEQLLGNSCHRIDERVLAATGALFGAASEFSAVADVPYGGVLLALPALCECGLLRHLELLPSKRGGHYYSLTHVFMLLAFMFLLRIRTVEQLRREHPGEFGFLLGLDRIPEVRCLRQRLAELSADQDSLDRWSNQHARDWLGEQAQSDIAGMLYVDGHLAVYNGKAARLPRHHSARLRLCMPGTMDYWVNDAEGKPFFYVTREADDGLLHALREKIVPKLLLDVPGQPTAEELAADENLPRFRLFFDREGYSPKFMYDMWREHRVACTTYRKQPLTDWDENEFHPVRALLPVGGTEEMMLAEKTLPLSLVDDSGDRIPAVFREVRRLREFPSGKVQTSIISTDFHCDLERVATRLFARWSQENFFRYMRREFALDVMNEHALDDFPCGAMVVNPSWKVVSAKVQSTQGKISRAAAEFAALSLNEPSASTRLTPDKILQMKEEKLAELQFLKTEKQRLLTEKKSIPRKIPASALPDNLKLKRIAPSRKLLLDTIRMMAYRAETALAGIAREHASEAFDEQHSLMKTIFDLHVDLVPEEEERLLEVVIHPAGEARQNRLISAIIDTVNAAEFHYPGTDLLVRYRLRL